MENETLPATLKELIEKEDHDGFKLAIGHFVELKHGLMGFFPAIESQSEEMVMTVDFELLKQICKTLTPRRSKFGTQILYFDSGSGMAYSVLGVQPRDLEMSKPYQVLTQARFDELMAKAKEIQPFKQPFKWAPGLVSNEMLREEFLETIESAARTQIA